MRGDFAHRLDALAAYLFQFTPLREGRRKYYRQTRLLFIFQFTPLREGRPINGFNIADFSELFQFTPLREGRLKEQAKAYTANRISIHAPA